MCNYSREFVLKIYQGIWGGGGLRTIRPLDISDLAAPYFRYRSVFHQNVNLFEANVYKSNYRPHTDGTTEAFREQILYYYDVMASRKRNEHLFSLFMVSIIKMLTQFSGYIYIENIYEVSHCDYKLEQRNNHFIDPTFIDIM